MKKKYSGDSLRSGSITTVAIRGVNIGLQKNIRDWAIILIGFAGAFRCSELVVKGFIVLTNSKRTSVCYFS